MVERPDVPPPIVARLRRICLALNETEEEQAWVGTRWTVRKRNFAHVVGIDAGWPPAYARAASTDGPAVVLTFRSSGQELAALSALGNPFFRPPWFPNIVGMVLDTDTDWEEVAELVTESYRLLAPAKLANLIGDLGDPSPARSTAARSRSPGPQR
jgi:predicted DNA-binding protein (MmcQ/YjbR family)